MDETRAVPVIPDQELVRRVAQDGDEASFHALYARHTPPLYRFALRLTGHRRHQAEDLVQETWLRAVRGLGAFRWEAQFATWLTAIAVRCFGMDRRRDAREVPVTDGTPEPRAEAPDLATRLDLEQAIATLPEAYRTVLLLHDVEGYTHQEIADLLAIPVGTSKAQLFRARRRMRARLRGSTTVSEASES
jgi:RNA polymerase sigma-70 factor (ECF subfamily)